MTSTTLGDRVRRAAKRIGLVAKRSRAHFSIDNHGGYMLVDPYRHAVVAGSRYDLTAEEVIAYCADDNHAGMAAWERLRPR